ncbi:hypothetical protein [Elioraea tepidiphila]|uniref:hypothetical protein n=1 Tax=Elioraea tepidiphila TaxID=457934 RepID=UPI00036BC828|nr:hypothetical protein [Elioraea tepidiphila]
MAAVLRDMHLAPATSAAAEFVVERSQRVVLAMPREVIARDSPGIATQGIERRLVSRGIEIVADRAAGDELAPRPKLSATREGHRAGARA